MRLHSVREMTWHSNNKVREHSGRKVLEGSFRLFVYEPNLIRLHITCRHYSRQIQIQIRPYFECVCVYV